MTDKKEQTVKPKSEDLSQALIKLYRLVYNASDGKDMYSESKLQSAYLAIVKQFPAVFDTANISSPPSDGKQLINIIKKLISNGFDIYIYGEPNKEIEGKEPKLALIEYCDADNIDQALLTMLGYKCQGLPSKDLVNYVHQSNQGWSSYSYAAIHKLLAHVNRHISSYANNADIKKRFGVEEIPYKLSKEEKEKIKASNKPKEKERDAYCATIVHNKYERRLLLLEFFLREQTSTTLRSNASGWRVSGKNESVFNQALSTNNMDVLRLIFQYGIDVDIDATCSSGGESMRSDWSKSWKPIHTAIERKNHELVKLMIDRGANVNCYQTERMSNEYGSNQDKQLTALYLICSQCDDDNKMLKLILKSHSQKHNGIPDVNKLNCYVTNDRKPTEVYQRERKAAKLRQRRDQHGGASGAADDTVEDEVDDEPVDEDEWDDPRSGYYTNPFINRYNYECALHVAIKKGDVEMVKLLLIYGADVRLCYIRTQHRYEVGYGMYRDRAQKKDRSVLMKEFYKKFMAKYAKNGLNKNESVQDVRTLLEASKGDTQAKGQIQHILDTGSVWFPELMEFYPNNMGQALEGIMGVLVDALPVVIINIIVEYFYNIIEQEIKEAEEIVDISNVSKKD